MKLMTDHLALFEDLVGLETRTWNQLDSQLRTQQGVPLAWFFALRRLAAAPDCRVSDLAEHIDISPGGASKLVDRLVTAGLVHRVVDDRDRRASRLRLTPEGTRVNRACSVSSEQWLTVHFQRMLDDEPLRDFASLLRLLTNPAHSGDVEGGAS